VYPFLDGSELFLRESLPHLIVRVFFDVLTSSSSSTSFPSSSPTSTHEIPRSEKCEESSWMRLYFNVKNQPLHGMYSAYFENNDDDDGNKLHNFALVHILKIAKTQILNTSTKGDIMHKYAKPWLHFWNDIKESPRMPRKPQHDTESDSILSVSAVETYIYYLFNKVLDIGRKELFTPAPATVEEISLLYALLVVDGISPHRQDALPLCQSEHEVEIKCEWLETEFHLWKQFLHPLIHLVMTRPSEMHTDDHTTQQGPEFHQNKDEKRERIEEDVPDAAPAVTYGNDNDSFPSSEQRNTYVDGGSTSVSIPQQSLNRSMEYSVNTSQTPSTKRSNARIAKRKIKKEVNSCIVA
jgi:hypothetical protein